MNMVSALLSVLVIVSSLAAVVFMVRGLIKMNGDLFLKDREKDRW